MRYTSAGPESVVSDRLAAELNGQREVQTRFGRIDVLTRRQIIEVKKLKGWQTGIGQLLSFRLAYPKQKLRLHILNPRKGSRNLAKKHKALEECAAEYGIKVTFEIEPLGEEPDWEAREASSIQVARSLLWRMRYRNLNPPFPVSLNVENSLRLAMAEFDLFQDGRISKEELSLGLYAISQPLTNSCDEFCDFVTCLHGRIKNDDRMVGLCSSWGSWEKDPSTIPKSMKALKLTLVVSP